MKVKAPFQIEKPKQQRAFGRTARTQFWYVWGLTGSQYRKVCQIVTWRGNFYRYEEGRRDAFPCTRNGHICGAIRDMFVKNPDPKERKY